MSLTDIISIFQAHNWLGLIALLTLLARKWSSADSKFPVTIRPTWQPTVTAGGGLIYGLVTAISAKQPAGDAIVAMLVTAGAGGFFDGVLTAVFDQDNAPVWARSLVFVFDDLTGGGTPPTGEAKIRIAKMSTRPPPPPPGPPATVRSVMTSVFFAVMLVAGVGIGLSTRSTTTGCTPAQQALFGKIENLVLADIEAGKLRPQIEADVGALLGGQVGVDIARLVDDAITLLLDAGAVPMQFVPQAKAMLAMHQVAK